MPSFFIQCERDRIFEAHHLTDRPEGLEVFHVKLVAQLADNAFILLLIERQERDMSKLKDALHDSR